MLRGLIATLFLLVFLAAGSVGASAFAETRVALVIGNSDYANVSKLPNPANDAEAIGLLLKSAGFDVVEQRQNLGNAEMRRAIRDFSEKVQDADLAVVFFAGHGIEINGANYLIPIDAKLERDVDAEDEAVSLDRILKMIEPARRLRLIILDACRDSPFGKSMKRTMVGRSIGRGLSPIEPAISDTLIAFAAKGGSTAADGAGINSPFTAALLQHLVTPGLDIRIALGQVRDDVLKATSNRQEPFVYGSLGGSMVTLTAHVKDEQAPTVDSNAAAARDYEAAAKIGTKEAWDAFVTVHPTGFYGELARTQREKLMNAHYTMERSRPSRREPGLGPKKATSINVEKQPKERWRQNRNSARTANARSVAYFCGSIPRYEQGLRDGSTDQLSLITVRRQCREARAGKLTAPADVR
ncbi:MAG: caspase domain-containing protein [Beijerinckiaceae bacterium]